MSLLKGQNEILKTIIARSFKLGQLIEDIMSRLTGETLNYYFFFSFCPLQIWPLETCNKDILKTITPSSIIPGQLIEDDE